MKRRFGRVAQGSLGLWLLLVPGCGEAQTGTNTNWLQSCNDSLECSAGASCTCGLCTSECQTDADCDGGVCGTALACLERCGGEDFGRFCIPPEAAECTELELTHVEELGPAVTPVCDVPGALVCESFDGPLDADQAIWIQNGATATLQDCEAAAGEGALRARTPEGGGFVQYVARLSQSVEAGPLFARFYAYVPAELVVPSRQIVFAFWNAEHATGDKCNVALREEDRLQLGVGPSEVDALSEPGVLPRDEWVCIEMALDVGAPGSAQLLVNGAVVVDEPTLDVLPPSPYEAVFLGSVPEGPETDLMLDELVIATEPIGCL